MDNHIQQVTTHFGAASLAPQGSLNLRTANSPIEYRTTFANNLGVPVTVMMRNGLKFVLEPEQSFDHRTMVIRVTIGIRPPAYTSVLQSLSDALAGKSKELEMLGNAIKLSIEGNSWNGGQVVLDYELTYEQLEKLGGSVYYHDVDYVVSLNPMESGVCHPHSEEGRKRQIVAESALFSAEYKEAHVGAIGFGFSIIMIDNQRIHQPRYINISNQIYKVTPQRDPAKRDGIFIVSNHSMSSKGGNGAFETRWLDFENAEETIGLYRTPDEALHSGDKATAAKESLVKMQAEVERMKAERQKIDEKVAIDKANHDAALREREVQLEKERETIARERAEREHQEAIRRQELKDHYEERSYVRKDSSEGLKFLPTLIVGLGALFGLFNLTR